MNTHFLLPKPRDWETLEDIVCDVFTRKYYALNMQRYGRRGQKQFGVDVAGLIQSGIIGIQCKHHPEGNISLKEIDDEISASEDFMPKLSEYFIVTSADRDVKIHSHVLQLSELRVANGKYPIEIMFWQDLYGWLSEFPDLIYKHFSMHFPFCELQEISFTPPRNLSSTLRWPTTIIELKESVSKNIGELSKTEPYNLALGITNFSNVDFYNLVDLEISLVELFENDELAENGFFETAKILNEVKSVVSDTYFSRELFIYLQTRITPAFLLGWIFRHVTHFELKLVFNNKVWATNGLPLVPTSIIDDLPLLLSNGSEEDVIILNISRDIQPMVKKFIESWEKQPRTILSYRLDGKRISSAAHALSIAHEISGKIKVILDNWQSRRIHIFCAMPAALATLISYNLNAIRPITLYFLDNSRDRFRIGGTLVNDL